METFDLAYIWLLAGIAMLLVEALGIPGVGFLFAGLGAIATGTALELGLIAHNAMTTQWLVFFASTILIAAALWKPMKKMRAGKTGYQNMVGDTAYVGSNGLDKHRGGEVTWSGTIMKAMLAKGVTTERMEAGAPVIITDVSGSTLIVKPQES